MASVIDKIKNDIIKALNASQKKTSAYDTEAEVVRIEGDTAWVHIGGGVPETPVALTINAQKGDKVQVRVSNEGAWITGNATAPPTDDAVANIANIKAIKAEVKAGEAYDLAEQAEKLGIENTEEMAIQVLRINGDIADLQNQIDGNITTWFYGYAPTLSNAPASSWSTDTDKDNHLGDLFYDTTTGYAYRFMKENNTYSWAKITDSDVTEALRIAAAAQDTADSKRRVFVTTPLIPSVAADGYDVGDLWVGGSNGDIWRCATAKTKEQSFSSTDWVLASKYTDDTVATNALGVANGADFRTQYIYISKASGTNTVSANTTWVTDATGNQNTWTTKRPQYSSSYPVLFIAKQSQTMAQSGGNTCSCTTPVKDDTTTVIDGGHITTGTIDASQVTVTNIDASKITVNKIQASQIQTSGITIGQSQVTDLVTDLGNKADTSSIPRVTYNGVMTSSNGTYAKVATCKAFSLATGAVISLYMSSSEINAAALTLNINGTGAKDIYVGGSAVSATNRLNWLYGCTVTFVYDGTNYVVADTPPSYMGGNCTTGAGTSKKETVVNQAVIFKGATITVPMFDINTATSPTLFIKNSGGTGISESNIYHGYSTATPIWSAYSSVTFTFDGQYWRTDISERFARLTQTGTSATATAYPWFKIASVNINSKNNQASISFDVTHLYTGNYDPKGKLNVYIRTGSDGLLDISRTKITWVDATETIKSRLSDFVIAYDPSNMASDVEVWVRVPDAYWTLIFKSLTETYSTYPTYNKWNLYINGSSDAKTSYTAGYLPIASKVDTASQYITRINGNGITVHAENNVDSNYTKINAEGMQIYQGGDEVATFGASEVELGKNNADSVIKLCNGAGQIYGARADNGNTLSILSVEPSSSYEVSHIYLAPVTRLTNNEGYYHGCWMNMYHFNGSQTGSLIDMHVQDEDDSSLDAELQLETGQPLRYYAGDYSLDQAQIHVEGGATLANGDVWFGFGTGGTNHGLYSDSNGAWIAMSDGSNNYTDDNFGPHVTSTSTSTGYYLGWNAKRWRGGYGFGAWNSSSDKKNKDVIGDLDFAKDFIMALEPVEFQWKDSDHKRSHMGLIAQDVADVAKSLGKDLSVYEASYIDGSEYHGEEANDNDLQWGMMYTELIAPLVKVVQEQQAEIDELKSIVAEQERR